MLRGVGVLWLACWSALVVFTYDSLCKAGEPILRYFISFDNFNQRIQRAVKQNWATAYDGWIF